jgi:predicted enzyme related to lactoylglutathione lyase
MAGRLVHFEIRAGDMARAQTFFGSLFGWKFNTWGGEVPYSLIDPGGEPAGGMYETDRDERGVLVYFDVDDVDGTLTRVRELGGSVLQERMAVPGVGWMARCRDTEGNEFSIFQTDNSAA